MPSLAAPDPVRAGLLRLFAAAVAAAMPERCLPAHLPPAPAGRLVVVGAGKAAAAMARVVEGHYGGKAEGLVVTRYGHATACDRIAVVEAGHPLPDQAGTTAAERILEMVRGLGPDDRVLFLASGGGSALLALPAPGLTLADKRAVTAALLRSGAAIAEINTVRRHLSAIKGGRLAAAAFPAPMLTLAISDVPGDDVAAIASGPGVADATTAADALAVLERYRVAAPPAVFRHLGSGDETPKPGDPRLSGAGAVIVAGAADALQAAAREAEILGWRPVVLGDAIEGEARAVACSMAAQARTVTGKRPTVLLSGGETSVTMSGSGRGGRNGEFLLALALALEGAPNIHALACDSDGIDGSEDNAGALVAPDTLARARALGLDPAAMLAANDSYPLFAALGDLVITGPTRTNVNDIRAILVE
ncbi:glycerate kinase [Magnetospirillum sp. UT-4]|uniref:glycerate kinase type-2 family protein n=1 Tax=Magnetospirillum sp. UT-4 TaxID=2681467 RepID=UPI00137CB45F|nr:glycerate kinase [Magnetospirillum sp. UT-4]CAA7622473.1 putative hydroxypyruvate reductase [Magnetospirillum sp. UT-4]